MEPTNDTPASDEDRRLAEAKKLTLQPLHPNIAPDTTDTSPENTETAADEAYMDIEQATPLIRPSRGLRDENEARNTKKQRLSSLRFVATVILAVSLVSSAAAFLALSR